MDQPLWSAIGNSHSCDDHKPIFDGKANQDVLPSRRMDMRSSIEGLLVAVGLLIVGQPAEAQGPGGYPGQKPGAVGTFANPVMNPYMNPYAAGMMPNNPDYLLYMLTMNQMNGGIGSGVISGSRAVTGQSLGAQGQAPGSTNQRPGQSSMMRNSPMTRNQSRTNNGRAPALMPLATTVPGAGAADYFNRGFSANTGAGRYYNRTGGRFQNNGR